MSSLALGSTVGASPRRGTRGDGSDTAHVSTRTVERRHWLNAVVGVIDAAWNLTAEEEHLVIRIVGHILDELDIPGRNPEANIPATVAMEVEGGFYSSQMSSADAAYQRPTRPLRAGDQTFTPDVWRDALVEMFTSAYPDLQPVERLWLSNTVADLLGGIGVANRAPAFLPEDVVRVAVER
jgi:hypothetical protein